MRIRYLEYLQIPTASATISKQQKSRRRLRFGDRKWRKSNGVATILILVKLEFKPDRDKLILGNTDLLLRMYIIGGLDLAVNFRTVEFKMVKPNGERRLTIISSVWYFI